MTTEPSWGQKTAQWTLAVLRWLEKFRYLKFGIVGASGTVVNLVVLHFGHEYVFNTIEAAYKKPYFSLALAIAIATINNFTWNRLWTWSDRVKSRQEHPTAASTPSTLRTLGTEFGQYAAASGFGSALQYGLTLLMSGYMDYRVANIVAIVIASVSNFLANDRWTFRKR